MSRSRTENYVQQSERAAFRDPFAELMKMGKTRTSSTVHDEIVLEEPDLQFRESVRGEGTSYEVQYQDVPELSATGSTKLEALFRLREKVANSLGKLSRHYLTEEQVTQYQACLSAIKAEVRFQKGVQDAQV